MTAGEQSPDRWVVSADAEGNEVVELAQPLDKPKDGDARWETGLISPALREQVLERDSSTCRFCGRHAEGPALHHVVYRSEGGLNVAENLITVHWMYAPRCHERIHSSKRRYQQLALYVATRPGLTVLQVERWQQAKARRRG